MKISVIGTGYFGAAYAAAMSQLGHDVLGVDVDADKVARLARGEAPSFEPELPQLLAQMLNTGRLRFRTSRAEAGEFADVHLCVGTPQRNGGEVAADLTYVRDAIDELAEHLHAVAVVVDKSTVPVRTAAACILIAGTPLIVTDFATAELDEVAANSFLATKISFVNALAKICGIVGAHVVQLADAIGLDERIGRKFLSAGLGFGGGCLPKDVRAFRARAGELGVDQAVSFLENVDAIDVRRRARTVDMARELCDGSPAGRRVGVLGAEFKPDSDDIRHSPALDVADAVQRAGAAVRVFDLPAMDNMACGYPSRRRHRRQDLPRRRRRARAHQVAGVPHNAPVCAG